MKPNLSAYRQIFDFSKRSPYLLTGLVVTSLLATFVEGFGASLILPLLDDSPLEVNIFEKIPYLKSVSEIVGDLGLTGRIQLAAVALASIVFIRSVFSYISQLFALYLRIHIETGLQKEIFSQLLAVQISFINQERQGHLMDALIKHTNQVGMIILRLGNGLIHCFTIIVYIALALLVSWQLTLIAMALFLLLIKLTNQKFSVGIRQLSSKRKDAGLRFMSTITEQISALHLTHLFAREKHSLDSFAATQQEYYSYSVRANKLVCLAGPFFNFLNALALSILLFSSTILLKDQSTGAWIGQITLFLVIAFRLIAPASALNQVKADMDNLLPYLQSVSSLLRRDDKPYLKSGSVYFEHLKEGIAFKNVTFKYHADEDRILEDVSIDIPRGKMTAIVGPSGSGKSTLVNLVTRLYDPENGSISVDGTNLREFDVTSWRSQLAVINQDVFLFNDTVQANLKFAKPAATDEEMFHATRLAQAHDFITNLPEGYDTKLGDRGVRLSGGQQQRIAIARAILVDPQLLILDEATSDLDSKTERAFQDAIEQYCEGHTLLVIAHRLSTIRKADKIIVLDAGAVIEQGTHEELMLKRGHYWQLLQTQEPGHETLLV